MMIIQKGRQAVIDDDGNDGKVEVNNSRNDNYDVVGGGGWHRGRRNEGDDDDYFLLKWNLYSNHNTSWKFAAAGQYLW